VASEIVLSVERRERTGSGGARAVRNAERVPGILYGGSLGPVPIEMERKALVKAIKSGKFLSHMVTLEHQGDRQPVIPRAIQFHPVSDLPIHFDLYRVDETSIIDVDVPVHFKNQDLCPGLKKGGSLTVVEHTLKLKAPAGAIPEEIVIDLEGLEVGAVIHVSSVTLPPGVEFAMKDVDATIATIAGRKGGDDGAETPAA
jgi:large subunit ribosomal protein L25